MRRVWTSILKSSWSLNPISVVEINSSASASGSARTTVASGKVAKVARSISKACADVPAIGSGLGPPVPSEFTQLVGGGSATSGKGHYRVLERDLAAEDVSVMLSRQLLILTAHSYCNIFDRKMAMVASSRQNLAVTCLIKK